MSTNSCVYREGLKAGATKQLIWPRKSFPLIRDSQIRIFRNIDWILNISWFTNVPYWLFNRGYGHASIMLRDNGVHFGCNVAQFPTYSNGRKSNATQITCNYAVTNMVGKYCSNSCDHIQKLSLDSKISFNNFW